MKVTTRAGNALAKKKIQTADALARWLPRAYHDYRTAQTIENCTPDRHHAVRGVLDGIEQKRGANGAYLRLKVSNGMGGQSFFVFMFSKTYLFATLSDLQGEEIVILGRVQRGTRFGYTMAEPEAILPAARFQPHIATVYPKIGGISDKALRTLVQEAVAEATEPLEADILTDTGLCGYREALWKLHAPNSPEDVREGTLRLRFNDLLYFALKILLERGRRLGGQPLVCRHREGMDTFLENLPFRLTGDQTRAIAAIAEAMSHKDMPMDTVLQGDVGSGKTVVAAAAMILAVENGGQAVLAVPRTVLAMQHLATMQRFFGDEAVVFLGGAMSKGERDCTMAKIADGRAKYIIGTHACFMENVPYHRLALVVTDEEHLFGVGQKEAAAHLTKANIHRLSMSATPIPRTISSILYAGRGILAIREKPAGRLPVQTEILSQRQGAIRRMAAEIARGHQCYVVCPAIDEDAETGLISVEAMVREYQTLLAPMGISLAVATGRMAKGEAEAAVARFADGKADVLLSTTVIEVGVDVPNATVIVIEQADRFGLATLHQLRGRVGRGNMQAYCLLLAEDETNARLQVLQATDDGFAIAEADAEIRGSGNLLGTEQHGFDRFVRLAAQNPARFTYAMQMAARCLENGLGNNLVELYENAALLTTESAKTKRRTKTHP